MEGVKRWARALSGISDRVRERDKAREEQDGEREA